LIKILAQAILAEFSRIQFTPDLLPDVLIGTQIYNPRTAEVIDHEIPIFTNLNLIKEVNRAATIPMKPPSPQQTATP
jgi:MoxR-like ATPase